MCTTPINPVHDCVRMVNLLISFSVPTPTQPLPVKIVISFSVPTPTQPVPVKIFLSFCVPTASQPLPVKIFLSFCVHLSVYLQRLRPSFEDIDFFLCTYSHSTLSCENIDFFLCTSFCVPTATSPFLLRY